MTAQVDLFVDDHGIATVTMRNPGRRNALTHALADGMAGALRSVAGDRRIGALVLRGGDGDFSVGGDLSGDDRVITGQDRRRDLARLRAATEVPRLLLDLTVPVIAHVEGACAGAGLSVALAADVRICSPDARFNTAFLAAGLSGDLGSAWLLSRTVGTARAGYLLLTSEKFDARTAVALGVVDEVREDHHERVSELARRLGTGQRTATGNAKGNLRDVTLSWGDYVARETSRMIESAYAPSPPG